MSKAGMANEVQLITYVDRLGGDFGTRRFDDLGNRLGGFDDWLGSDFDDRFDGRRRLDGVGLGGHRHGGFAGGNRLAFRLGRLHGHLDGALFRTVAETAQDGGEVLARTAEQRRHGDGDGEGVGEGLGVGEGEGVAVPTGKSPASCAVLFSVSVVVS